MTFLTTSTRNSVMRDIKDWINSRVAAPVGDQVLTQATSL
jgi:hypothetical protein